jgi:hypothetical protein
VLLVLLEQFQRMRLQHLNIALTSEAQIEKDGGQTLAPGLDVEVGLAAARDRWPGLIKGLGENLQRLRIEGLATVERGTLLHDTS